ncbi:hypothetical protein FOL47_000692 [Perkinsus chesapeaki]|uniref:Protein ENHANCED DISEASE RESISTANCE 2 C-terminal domain-containing protein n=1 Tax=Perkinsus chesapeaki TaxID=330153 RepID=A0A7J6MLT6_PERCH|nr:hypothetical protein FOL47_000692 [Perkinsus chesapeaki]
MPSESSKEDANQGKDDERIEEEIVSQIEKAKRKGSKSWEKDTDDEYEQEYLASLKNEGKQKSYIGGAAGGVAAAVGSFMVFASPLAVAGAAAVGAGTAWKYMRDKGRREVKAAEGDMRTSDHSGDVSKTIFGSEGSGSSRIDNNNKAGGHHHGRSSEVESILSGGRPSLKRLKFLVSWAKLQVEESLPHIQRAVNTGDNVRITQQAVRLEKILDEVVMSFSPWVQRQYLVRAEKDKAKRHRGIMLIKIHLVPLYRFLGGETVHKAVSFCNAEFLDRWQEGDVDPENVLQRCRGVFPTVLETVVIIRSTATSPPTSSSTSSSTHHNRHDKSAAGEGQRSRSGSSLMEGGTTLADRRVSDTADWITNFLRREDVTEFLSSSLVHAHWVHRKQASAAAKVSEPSNADGKVAEALDEEEQVKPIEFPPLGAELEMDEAEYYSASEGEESDGEAEKFRRMRKNSGKMNEEVDGKVSRSGEAVIKVEDILDSEEGPQPSEDDKAENTWDCIDCSTMQVRGGSYLTDRLKEASDEAIMRLDSFDLFYTDKEIFCATQDPHCKAHWLWKKNPERFYFVINWRMFPLQLAVTYSVDLNNDLFTSDKVVGAAKKLVIDVGFVIEGQAEDELPERMIGGFRIRYPDLTLTRRVQCGAVTDES